MTLLCRPPLRLLHRLAAARPHAATIRPQTSAVNLIQCRLASKVSNASHKSGFDQYPTSALEAARKLAYPQRLQIYNAPALEIATIGTFKLAGLFILSMACLVVAPNVYADESSPLWMTPAVIAVSATVLPLFHVLTRPFVAQVFIDAPAQARRSKEALVHFARHLPPDTAMEIQTLGLLPWPRTKTLRVGQLRIRPEGWGRLANLEQVTALDNTSKIPKWARWSLQRFYARPAASHWKNSRAPEVWPLVFEAITRNTVANLSSKSLSPPVGAVSSTRTPPLAKVARTAQPMPTVGQKKVPAVVQKMPTPKAAPSGRQNSRKKK